MTSASTTEYTNILKTLTDEEREAISQADVLSGDDAAKNASDDPDSEDDDDPSSAVALPIEGKGDDAQAAPPVEGKGAADEVQPEPEAKPAEPAKAETAPEPQAPAATPAAAPPQAYTFNLPADFAQQVESVKEKESALWSKFDTGDISREELQREMQALTDNRQALLNMQLKAEMSADMQRQQAEHARGQAVEALFTRAAKADGGGIDYRSDKSKLAQLDTVLKALAADDAHADKPLDWFLSEAHKVVLAVSGIAAPAGKSTVDPKAAVSAALAARKPDTTGLDATLAHVPGGQGAGDVGGEFDDILALEGEAFEDALADMSRKQPQRFARFQAAGM